MIHPYPLACPCQTQSGCKPILGLLHVLQVIEEAGEKVTVAEDAYSLVDKYMRKLDQELLKFKLELEADNRGITEILEKRSLEMDQQQVSYQGFAFI